MSVQPTVWLRCGADWTFAGPLTDASGSPLPLAGASFVWQLDSLDLTQNILKLTSVAIINQSAADIQYGPTGAQTLSVPPGTYYQTLKVTLSTGQILYPVEGVIVAQPAPA